MESKYSIRFTGKLLNENEHDTLEAISLFFPATPSTNIELLIKNKATFKKSIDLLQANKIKSKLEQAGVECLIFEETSQAPLNTTNQKEANTLEQKNKKPGMLTILLAATLMLCTLLQSNGYDPRASFFWNLSESMYLYKGYPFGCSKEKIISSGITYSPDGKINYDPYTPTITSGGCANSFRLNITTRHTIFVLLIFFMFGVARYLGTAKPIAYYWNRAKALFI